MKKIAIFTSILALAACGGGSGSGHSGGSGAWGGHDGVPGVETPETVDLTITNLPDSVDNKDEIVSYVEAALGDVIMAQSSQSVNAGRKSAARHSSLWSGMNIDEKYDLALAEYKNMYNAAMGQALADDAYKNAYLLAGGKFEDFDWGELSDDNRDEIRAYIHERYEDILKKFFWWIDNKPSWEYKKQNLADMDFNSFGNRAWNGDSYIKILQTNNGKITKINMNDPHDGIDYDITIDKSGKGVSAPKYTYFVPFSTGYGIDVVRFETDKELKISEIKDGLKNVLNTDFPYMSDEQKNQIIADIDNMSDKNKKEYSYYDGLERLDTDDLGYWFVQKEAMNIDNLSVYGKSAGLRYSDFGRVVGTYNVGDLSIDRKYVFAGGYDIKQVDKDRIESEMNFSGKAVGNVVYHRTSETDNSIEHSYLDLESNDVKLNFNNGTETLTMKFPNWYDVKVVQNKNGDGTITFANGDRISDSKYKFDKNEYSLRDDDIANGHVGGGVLEAKYYGDNFVPTEVAGKVDFLQQNWKNDNESGKELYNEEKYFMSAFGGTVTK